MMLEKQNTKVLLNASPGEIAKCLRQCFFEGRMWERIRAGDLAASATSSSSLNSSKNIHSFIFAEKYQRSISHTTLGSHAQIQSQAWEGNKIASRDEKMVHLLVAL